MFDLGEVKIAGVVPISTVYKGVEEINYFIKGYVKGKGWFKMHIKNELGYVLQFHFILMSFLLKLLVSSNKNSDIPKM